MTHPKKDLALTHIRSDIGILSDQNEQREIDAYKYKLRGQIQMLVIVDILAMPEAEALENELVAALKRAQKNVKP